MSEGSGFGFRVTILRTQSPSDAQRQQLHEP